MQNHTHRNVPADVSSKHPLHIFCLVVEVAAPISERFRSTREYLKDQVKFAHTIYLKWETIVDNLTDPEVTRIDAQKLSVEQL